MQKDTVSQARFTCSICKRGRYSNTFSSQGDRHKEDFFLPSEEELETLPKKICHICQQNLPTADS